MRIGIDYTSAATQGAGIGRYTRELMRALLALPSNNRYSFFYASPNRIDESSFQSPTSNLKPPISNLQLPTSNLQLPTSNLQHLPFHDKWLMRLWQRFQIPLPVELIVGKIDLFHSPDFTLPPTLPGVPTLLTVHDLSFVRDPDSAWPSLRAFLNKAVPRSVKRATHVLADSLATKNDLIELFGTSAEKITVLYGGVEARFAPVPDRAEIDRVCAKYQLPRPFILSVGTLQPRKNYGRLIQAFAEIIKHPAWRAPASRIGREQNGARTLRVSKTKWSRRMRAVESKDAGHLTQPHPSTSRRAHAAREQNEVESKDARHSAQDADLHLVIAGGQGWLYESIFDQVKLLGLENRVHFPGFVDDADLPALYSAAEVFAYVSTYEGFGLPLLEAMACGTPAVASNVSSLPEVIGDAGLQVDPRDVSAIARAFDQMLTKSDLRATSIAAGIERARTFTWEKAAGELLAIYDKMKG
jgi:glycosyltransferase involved in cell wall biosynthesis